MLSLQLSKLPTFYFLELQRNEDLHEAELLFDQKKKSRLAAKLRQLRLFRTICLYVIAENTVGITLINKHLVDGRRLFSDLALAHGWRTSIGDSLACRDCCNQYHNYCCHSLRVSFVDQNQPCALKNDC